MGRILKSLVARGRVQPVVRLRKSPKLRHSYRRRHAIRLPRGFKPARPGAGVQIDPVFITLSPGKAIKHFTPYCAVAKWAVAKAVGRATARAAGLFLDKVLEGTSFPVQAIQINGGSESRCEFETASRTRVSSSANSRPSGPSSTAQSSAAMAPGDTRSTASTTLPRTLKALNPLLDSFQHLYNHHRPYGALTA